MATTPAAPPLARFRAELYQSVLGLRRDGLCELLDAVLCGDGARSLVRHSLTPCFRRGWAAICDALADGSLDLAALQRLFAQTMPAALVEDRLLWVVDGTIWPRPEAKTSPERTWGRFVTGGTPQSGIIGAWEYQWLAAIPEAMGSWVLPLAVGRRGPQAGTATTLAIAQLRAAQAARPADAPRPLLLLDSHYDVAELVAADLGVDLLARLAANRRFYRPPGPYPGKGAPRKHGPVFRCADPTTHGSPDHTQTEADAVYGTVTIDIWERLHTQPAPTLELTVIRVSLGRLPRREQPPKPLWLVWHGGALPADVRTLQRWYQRRFAVEHAFRFLKQDLGWTTIRPRSPQSADRWSWLLAAALWQLWLARDLVADHRLPWERAPVATARSPGRVRRGFAALVLTLGTPARPPRVRGKSPGRQVGHGPGPAPRCPVLRRGPPKAA
jgi:DDE superfamily endonuclease